jgi:hypothetical protein
VGNREARIVAAGPLRTVVDMRVERWAYMGDSLSITCRYISYAGHRDVEARVLCGKPLAPGVVLCTGVQKMKQASAFFSDSRGMACLWGTGFPVNDTVKYGLQTVGMAVLAPADSYSRDTIDKVNHLLLLRPEGRREFTYHFWAASEKEEWWQVKTAEDFFGYSAQQGHLLRNPLRVEL